MDITYLGAGSIKLTGRGIGIVLDPQESLKNLAADVTLLTAPDIKAGDKAGMVIDGPGEYEVKDALVTGVPARLHVDELGERGTIYTVVLEDIRIGILGNVAPGLSDEQLEAMGQVDVLIVPVGGKGLTLDSVAAAQVVSQIEPKYVVPVHYDDGVTKYPMPQDKVDVFLAEMGVNPEPAAKLKISAKDLPLETTVAVLQAQKG